MQIGYYYDHWDANWILFDHLYGNQIFLTIAMQIESSWSLLWKSNLVRALWIHSVLFQMAITFGMQSQILLNIDVQIKYFLTSSMPIESWYANCILLWYANRILFDHWYAIRIFLIIDMQIESWSFVGEHSVRIKKIYSWT